MDGQPAKAPDAGADATSNERRQLVDRALRHDLRIPLRYRLQGDEAWQAGETINISQSGLLFSSNELLEVDSRLEITFQTSDAPMLQRSTRVATIVRRILSNWPETQLVFGARFSS